MKSWLTAGLAMACLAVVIDAADVKYSELVAKDAVFDMGIKMSYKDAKNEKPQLYNNGDPCAEADDVCQDPIFNYDKESKLVLTFKKPKDLAKNTPKSVGGVSVGEPVSVTFKACFAKEWTDNRKWRKAKDVISKDKRCRKEMVEGASLDAGEVEFALPSDTPIAQWFITALINCKREGDDTEVCGMDTTGGLGALAKAKDVAADGLTEEEAGKRIASAKTSDILYYRTENMDSRPPGLVTGVIVLSVASWTLLIGYFVYERLLKKNK